MQTRARYNGRCLKCGSRMKRGDRIAYVPPKRKPGRVGHPGKTFCRRCVTKLHLVRFPPAADGKVSAWLRAQELEMVERELAKTTRRMAV